VDVVIDAPAGVPTLAIHDPDDFTKLAVRLLHPGATESGVDRILRGSELGLLDGRSHAWLNVARLRALAGHGLPGWDDGFDAMLAFARDHGWTSADGSQVRAHCTWPDGASQ
jgi:hypothetical protein